MSLWFRKVPNEVFKMLVANQVCFLTKQHPSAINIRRFLQPWERSLRPWEDIWVHQEIFICSSLVQPLLKDQYKTMMEHSQLYKMASAENRHQVLSWSCCLTVFILWRQTPYYKCHLVSLPLKGACLRQGCHPKRGNWEGGGGWGVWSLNKISNGKALPRDPIPPPGYPFIYHFWQKMFTLSIPSIDKGSPFT